jgi:hypothetical protein
VSVQDSCMVSAKHTICLEILWTHSLVTLGEEAQVEVIHDRCMVRVECTIGLEIALDAPDGTLRRCGSFGILVVSLWRQCYYRCKIGARFVQTYHRLRNHFGRTRWCT